MSYDDAQLRQIVALPDRFRHLYTDAVLTLAIRRCFPKEDHQLVADLIAIDLAQHTMRVRIAVVLLSAGDFHRLDHFIALAKVDYRDVLAPFYE